MLKKPTPQPALTLDERIEQIHQELEDLLQQRVDELAKTPTYAGNLSKEAIAVLMRNKARGYCACRLRDVIKSDEF
jgi:hypothetical protein